jgi:hypothetical protein
MTIWFTGLEASPWICTASAAAAVPCAGSVDLLELQPAHANTTAAANATARKDQLLPGIGHLS